MEDGDRKLLSGRASDCAAMGFHHRAPAPAVPGSIEIGNLTWVSGATGIMYAPARQAMVDLFLVPKCPSQSMTSVVAINCVVASSTSE